MTRIREELRFALYEGERQVTDYIWPEYHDLDYYIILSNDKESWVYNKETKKFAAKIKGKLDWCNEYEDYLVVKEAVKYGVYSFDGNVILPVEFSEIDEKNSCFAVKDMNNLCGVFSIKGENIVPIQFEEVGSVLESEDKKTINAVAVTNEGTRGWYIIKSKRFVPASKINITKTGIIEVYIKGKWYILDDTEYLNIVHEP